MKLRINYKEIGVCILITLAALLLITYATSIIYQSFARILSGNDINYLPVSAIIIGITEAPALVCAAGVAAGILFLKTTEESTSPLDALKKDERGFSISDNGEYGTAHWQEREELVNNGFIVTQNINDIDGIVFGMLPPELDPNPPRVRSSMTMPWFVGLPWRRRVTNNTHIMTLGTSGSGKTSRALRLMIDTAAGRGESMVVTDMKLELYADYKLYLESLGYEVRIMNIGDLSRTDTFNPLAGIRHDEYLIQQITKLIVDSAYDDAGTTHYTAGAQSVLNALTMYVCLSPDYTDEQANLITAHTLLTRAGGDYKKLSERFERLNVNHPARIAWDTTKWGSENARGNLFQEISLMLQSFSQPGVRRFLMGHENPVVIEDLGRKKTALFISSDSSSKSLKLLGTLFFATVLARLKALADSQANLRLPVPVNMILDEVCALDKIGADDRQFINAINTDRSRGISYMLGGQDIPTFEAKFGIRETQTIMGQCAIHILTGADPGSPTAQHYSKKTGEMTTKFVSTRYDAEGNASESIGSGRRSLVDATEITQLLKTHNLIFVQGHPPIKVLPVPYEEMPSYEFIKDHPSPVADIPAADLSAYALYVAPTAYAGTIPKNAAGESEEDVAYLPGEKKAAEDPNKFTQTPIISMGSNPPSKGFYPHRQTIPPTGRQNGSPGQSEAFSGHASFGSHPGIVDRPSPTPSQAENGSIPEHIPEHLP